MGQAFYDDNQRRDLSCRNRSSAIENPGHYVMHRHVSDLLKLTMVGSEKNT